MKSLSKQLMGAASIPIILSILKGGDSYGYEIVQKVKELTNGEITWKEASIYPVLKKLESGKMIKSYWIVKEGERSRRYYTILEEGKKMQKKSKGEWLLVYSVLEKFWSPDN